MVAMATSLTTYRPHPTRFLQPIWAHNPNGIPVGSAVFAQMTVELGMYRIANFTIRPEPDTTKVASQAR